MASRTFPDNSLAALRFSKIVAFRIRQNLSAGGAVEPYDVTVQSYRLLHELQALIAQRGAQWAEDELQALVVAGLRSDLLEPWVITWHHSPLGFDRSAVQAYQAKRTGATAGWPDLQLLLRKIDGSPVQLLIELKTDTGSLSTVQKHAHEKIRAAGLAVVTCWGILAVVDALVDAISGHPLKTAYKHRDALAGSAG